MSAPIIHVVDDDPSFRTAVTRLLRAAKYEVRGYRSASEFLGSDPCADPGCILLDLRMPGLNGLDLQQSLAQMEGRLPIIFLSGHGDIPASVRAMKAGAVDFLPKPFRDDDLLGCVERALIRSAEQRTRSAEENEARTLLGLLTPRELEVMQLVVTGMLNKQIAGELGTAEKTVKVHRGRAMRKLNVTSVAELVRLTEKACLAPAANV